MPSAQGTDHGIHDDQYPMPMARVAVRVLLEFALSALRATTILCKGQFETGIFLVILLREAQSFDAGSGAVPEGVSVNALAASFGKPFETVRRHVNRLIELGICRRAPKGVAFSPEPEMRGATDAFLVEVHDLTLRLFEDLHALEYPVPPGGGSASFDQVTQGGLDLLVQCCDIGTQLHEVWIRMYLYYGVMTANARSITFDRDLAHRYSDSRTPPPEAVRRPVSARMLSRALGLPYSTVRRHLAHMERIGQIFRLKGGWMLTMEWMQKPEILASGHMVCRKIDAMLAHASRMDFPLGDPAAFYRRGRPGLLEFA